MNKLKQNELLRTGAFYLTLFIITSLITSGLLIQPVTADPENCGDERVHPDAFFYAEGINEDTYYDIYGVKAKSLITDLDICGHFESDGSVGGNLVWVTSPDLTFIETGYYKGNYSETGEMVSNNHPHYFWGAKSDIGELMYGDISEGTEIDPVLTNWINFSTWGNVAEDHDWHVRIEKAGSYTINVNGISLGDNMGYESSVVMEMHNSYSEGTGHFKDIENKKKTGSSLYWESWLNSYGDNDDPFYAVELDDDEYCMDTSEGTCS